MKKMMIKMNNLSDVVEFVKRASLVNGDVLLKKDVYVTDGKSLFGTISIDMSTGVKVEFPEGEKEFENYLLKFAS